MLNLALLLFLASPSASPDLLVGPYAQLGGDRGLTILWHTKAGSKEWALRTGGRVIKPTEVHRIAAPGMAPHDVVRTFVDGLQPGSTLQYEILQNGDEVQAGSARVPAAEGQSYSFVALGDIGRGTQGQKRIAHELYRTHPDFVVMLGDIVYPRGRMTEYRQFLWPIWANRRSSPTNGAPILNSTLTVPVAGNHDTAYRNVATYPDALAYYVYWHTPANGPPALGRIQGPKERAEALDRGSGGRMSRMANYTFRYGNSSWVVLDSNHYVDWKRPEMRKWLDGALATSRRSTWSFVAMHGPAYSSSRKHGGDTIMRSITDLLDKHSVDVVFAGHVHNYQRTFPLTGHGDAPVPDKSFDGRQNTRANGTIHIVSGAGGAELYDQNQPDRPSTWRPFTAEFLSGHSFTKIEVDGRTLRLKQIDSRGATIDSITVQK